MLRHVVQRRLLVGPVLPGVLAIGFLLMQVVPTEPAAVRARPMATQDVGAALRNELSARIARAAAAVEMGHDCMEAGRAIGMSNHRLIAKYLLPNCLSALLVWSTLCFGQVILLGSSCSSRRISRRCPAPPSP